MGRVLGVVLIYAAMLAAWSGVGLFMLIAPARFGNLVHDNLYLFPEVTPRDWGKKLVLRMLGTGLLAFAIRLVLRAAHSGI
jgi:hypothetical protein